MSTRIIKMRKPLFTTTFKKEEARLRWNGALYMDQKVSFNLGKKDQFCSISLMNRKWILKVTQNGRYGNQPQRFEVEFYSFDTNTSCSFTKQDFTVKQAYRVSFCFVLWYEPKFW